MDEMVKSSKNNKQHSIRNKGNAEKKLNELNEKMMHQTKTQDKRL
jgi:hypothetical protein